VSASPHKLVRPVEVTASVGAVATSARAIGLIYSWLHPHREGLRLTAGVLPLLVVLLTHTCLLWR
jgi:hypothetical protein